MTPLIAGISCFFHDSAAALAAGDAILAAAEEERFSRHKHDAGFPTEALAYCLAQAPGGRTPDAVIFYEDPALKVDRRASSNHGGRRGVELRRQRPFAALWPV